MSEMHRRPGAMRKGLSRLQCAVLIALGALSLAGAARAEDPAIRIVVSLPAGGGVDVMARYLAQQLGKELQRSVVVENRPGGSGTIAARAVMNAPEGQTTLLAGGNQEITIAPHLLKDAHYRPLESLVPVLQVGVVPSVVVAKAGTDAGPDALLQGLKERRDLSIGIPGRGTPMHIALEDVAHQAGGQFLAVPYKGAPDVLTGVLSGSTRYGAVGYSAAKSMLDGGSLVTVAVLAQQRSPLLPQVPAMAEQTLFEQGLPQVWYGFFMPGKTAEDEVRKISAAFERLLGQAPVQARLRELGIQVTGLGESAFAQALEAESRYYRDAILQYKVQ
ncbi:tripartite tricarboxylate transporter substrate binding protein [Bordetella trematum]|nr:tripartite tricarboxylate transporter substrate binding protein [Bordetella trematum]NNH19711.1 tripartite tricarboxylate transporter substrate binding protein [Bordetella trematum]